MRAAAEVELRAQIEASGTGHDEELTEAAAALEAADRHPWRKHWQTALVGLMLAVSLPLLALAGLDMTRHGGTPLSALKGNSPEMESAEWPQAYMTDTSERARLILTGDSTASNEATQWRPLWDSEPDNPAFLAQYAAAYFQFHRRLSPEIIEAAKRIDPDNGWFPLIAAAGLAKEAVERLESSPADLKTGEPTQYKVRDETKLQESLRLLHEAAGMPRFSSYQTDLHRIRCGLIAPPYDLPSAWIGTAFVIGPDSTDCVVDLRFITRSLAVAVRTSGEQGDAAGFERLLADWQWLYRSLIAEEDSLLGCLVGRSTATILIREFRDAATALGMKERAAVLARMDETLLAQKRAKDLGGNDWDGDLPYERGSQMAKRMTIGHTLVKESPMLTDNDLRPGRLAEHARWDRILAVVAWIWLGTGSVALVARRQFNRRMKPLAARMTLVLRPGDLAMILSGGVLLPLAWFVIITRFTPLTARSWALSYNDLPLMTIQHATLWLLILLAPITLARWCLGRRGAAIGMRGRRLWLDAVYLGLLALALPLAGWEVMVMSDDLLIPTTLCLLGIPALRLLVLIGKFLLPSAGGSLRRAVAARAVVPAWIFAMLLCGLALPFHHAEERYWTQSDDLTRVPPDVVAWSRYEGDLLPILRQETTELLKPLDALAK